MPPLAAFGLVLGIVAVASISLLAFSVLIQLAWDQARIAMRIYRRRKRREFVQRVCGQLAQRMSESVRVDD